MAESEIHVAHTGSPWDGRLELIIALVLGLAAIAGAFSAYKREGHEHDAQAKFTRGTNKLTQSTAALEVAQQRLAFDNLLFLEWYLTPKDSDANFLKRRVMDKPVREATTWWINHASFRVTGNTPFNPKNPHFGALPEAQFASVSQAESSKSRDALNEARDEQNIADSYTRVEIVLATALFLLGVAGVTRHFRIRIAALGIGLVTFGGALAMLIVI
jgi:uncharacterized membrane protein YgdD (TMEM256/DUF423 family)